MSDTDIRRRFHEMVATQSDIPVKGKAATYTACASSAWPRKSAARKKEVKNNESHPGRAR